MARQSNILKKPDPEPSSEFRSTNEVAHYYNGDDSSHLGASKMRQDKMIQKGKDAHDEDSDGSDNSDNSISELDDDHRQSPFSAAWTQTLVKVRRPVSTAVCWMSDTAARHPRLTVIIGIVLALELAALGCFTNFNFVIDGDVLWTPTPSTVLSHGDYINEESGFSAQPRWARMTIHANGANLLANPQACLDRVFAAFDVMVGTDGYDYLCNQATDTMLHPISQKETCKIGSITKFFNYSSSVYRSQVATGNDLRQSISQVLYPDGTPVVDTLIMGNSRRNDAGELESAQILMTVISLPELDETPQFEERFLDRMLDLQEQWINEDANIYRLEVFSERSFDDELRRAVVTDIPLVPSIFVVMSLFTALVFWQNDWIESRCLLGFGAVCSVFLSILFGYGIMFIIGVPFTSMTQIVPFVMFGIGLDDAFIIWGAFQRMDRSIPISDRIHDTMAEVGVSIFVTTLTSVVAFALGSLSAVPVVYWLCYYAAPTIFIDFIYQTTFFVALIVLDEQRVENKKRDCCVCCKAPASRYHDEVAMDYDDDHTIRNKKKTSSQRNKSLTDLLMSWYSGILLKPVVKVVVLVVFGAMFAGLGYSASLLKQHFSYTDVLPDPSYAGDFWGAFEDYTGGSAVAPFVIFRQVNQSRPEVRQEMVTYVDGLVDMKEVKFEPEFFWVKDFEVFAKSNQSIATVLASVPMVVDGFSSFAKSQATVAESLAQVPFVQQLELFLSIPVYKELYKNDIVRDGTTGEILASRTRIRMTELDQHSVTEQVDALEHQRQVSETQPTNSNLEPEDWNFFTFIKLYYIWQFYTEALYELVLTTILGIGAVSLITLIFIPHWSSLLFVAPMISILYVDLLGFLQLCGVSINAVSYLSLVMSIGLLVDFLLHILLRFFESKESTRDAKVKDVLQTMGSSILVGGVSTFLGVVPLMFSQSDIFSTIYYSFLGLVVFGMTHGLILLPVVLSLFGPNVILEL